jgi:type IV secretory pathway TrbF-like protein
MSSNDQVTKFTPEGDIETPYTRAKKEWDDRIGSSRVQAYNWRLAFFTSSILCLVLGGGLVYMTTRQHVIPYIIKVNKIGKVQSAGPADKINYTPGRPEITYFLSEFVVKIRTISFDPVVMKRDWLSAYDFVTPRGTNQLNSLASRDNPFDKLGQMTVSVDIVSVIPISDTSFQAEWSEKVQNKFGSLMNTFRYKGIFTITIKEPKDESRLLKNPLGIFIDSFNFSRL